MGAGGGGGAVAAVRRFVDTVRKYNEVRSVEDGVRDGLGEGVVEAEADELALPPDEGDHQHAISMQSTTSWHAHLMRETISMQSAMRSACNQRRLGTPT